MCSLYNDVGLSDSIPSHHPIANFVGMTWESLSHVNFNKCIYYLSIGMFVSSREFYFIGRSVKLAIS